MNSSLTDNQSHYKPSKTSVERLKHKARCCTISYVEILYGVCMRECVLRFYNIFSGIDILCIPFNESKGWL